MSLWKLSYSLFQALFVCKTLSAYQGWLPEPLYFFGLAKFLFAHRLLDLKTHGAEAHLEPPYYVGFFRTLRSRYRNRLLHQSSNSHNFHGYDAIQCPHPLVQVLKYLLALRLQSSLTYLSLFSVTSSLETATTYQDLVEE